MSIKFCMSHPLYPPAKTLPELDGVWVWTTAGLARCSFQDKQALKGYQIANILFAAQTKKKTLDVIAEHRARTNDAVLLEWTVRGEGVQQELHSSPLKTLWSF